MIEQRAVNLVDDPVAVAIFVGLHTGGCLILSSVGSSTRPAGVIAVTGRLGSMALQRTGSATPAHFVLEGADRERAHRKTRHPAQKRPNAQVRVDSIDLRSVHLAVLRRRDGSEPDPFTSQRQGHRVCRSGRLGKRLCADGAQVMRDLVGEQSRPAPAPNRCGALRLSGRVATSPPARPNPRLCVTRSTAIGEAGTERGVLLDISGTIPADPRSPGPGQR